MGLEGWETNEETSEVLFISGGWGGGLGAVGSGESHGDVVEVERNFGSIDDTHVGDGVEVVLKGIFVADDYGLFMEDDVLRQHVCGLGEGEVGGEGWNWIIKVRDDEGDDGEDGDGNNRRDQEVAAFCLGKG